MNSTGNRTGAAVLTTPRSLLEFGYTACMDAMTAVVAQYMAVRDGHAALSFVESGLAGCATQRQREARIGIERLIGLRGLLADRGRDPRGAYLSCGPNEGVR